MTEQERVNKKEARRLINLPLSKRPDNVYMTPPTRLNHRNYMVQFGDIGVYFQHDGKQLYYLGEYPASNWNSLKRQTDG